MVTRKAGKKAKARPSASRSEPGARSARFKQISKGSSQIVRDAAVLLDDEIASGILAAKQMQQRFQKQRRIDPSDFKDALKRFQGDAHEVVNLLNDQFAELRSEENAQLVGRFTSNAHNLLDLVVELAKMGAEIADQVAQSNLPKKESTRNGQAGR
jgi:hypothetical protein